MSTAPALAVPRVSPANETRTAKYLYGDSTPFPHDCDFIEIIHRAVDCGVALMKAQHAIGRSRVRLAELERRRQADRASLLGLAEAVKRAVQDETQVGTEVARRTATRALAVTRAVVETELTAIESEIKQAAAAAAAALEEAKVAAERAIEQLVMDHDVPGTQVALRLALKGEGYAATAMVMAPYGLEAWFEARIPEGHAWSTPRRVGDFGGALDVRVPRDAGWFSKRVELRPLKLGKHLVRAVAIEPSRGSLVLARGAQGCRFELDPRDLSRVFFTEIGEDGADVAPQPFELAADDAAKVARAWNAVVAASRDVPSRRTAMTRALVDAKPLASFDPQTICERMMHVLAPIAREVGRRAGATGELVLRKDAGARRRDEIYITKAELLERVHTLPPALRLPFDALDLVAPRSPRAPAPSLPAYVEVADADILEEGVPTAALRR